MRLTIFAAGFLTLPVTSYEVPESAGWQDEGYKMPRQCPWKGHRGPGRGGLRSVRRIFV